MLKKIIAGLLSLSIVLFGGLSVAFAEHGDTDVDCENFGTGEEVMEFWTSHGYSTDNDPMDLDRGDNPLPCENLTEGLNPADYENNDTAMEEEVTEPAAEEEEGSEEAAVNDEEVTETTTEEGGELADTATNTPLMMLIGIAIAGSGAILFTRKRRLQ